MNADSVDAAVRLGDNLRIQRLGFDQDALRLKLSQLPDSKRFKHEKYFAGDPLFEFFLFVSESEIKYCLGIGRWQQMPYFSLLDFRNLQAERSFVKADRIQLNQLFTEAFDYMHRERRFTFFYATRIRPLPRRHVRRNGEFAPVRGIPIFDRYDFTIEAEVPIGAEPEYLYQQKLVRMTDRAYDYWLKRGTLKMAHLSSFFSSLST